MIEPFPMRWIPTGKVVSEAINLIKELNLSFIDTDIMKLKGYLKPVILKLLSREDRRTGSELVEQIEEELGSRPSYGSIYPTLQKLKEKNLVDIEKEGKEKRYSLSEEGVKFVEKIKSEKREQMESLLSMLRTFKTIFEDEGIDILIKNIEKRKDKDGPFFPELNRIHHLLLTQKIEGKKERIRSELQEVLDNLEEILED